MKKKLTILLVAASLAAALGFFIYFIADNELSRRVAGEEDFIPEEIDISTIKDDVEFARTIPDYEILYTGLVGQEKTTDFLTILEDNMDVISICCCTI